MVNIRKVKKRDLPRLVTIEHQCFSNEEAATKEAIEKRVQLISDSFFVAEVNGLIVGFVNGPVIDTPFITDDLFSEIMTNPPSGGHQSILGVAVAPDYQKQGIATALLTHLEKAAITKKRKTMTLTCKKELISYYEKLGYVKKGISTSVHGGIQWYNLVKEL